MFLGFVDRWMLHSSDIYPFILQWWIAIAIIGVFIGCLFLVLKKPLGFNKKIQNRTWLILGVLMLMFLIVNLSFNSFWSADEEWDSIYQAKTMLDGNKRVYVQEKTGIVFPLLAAGLLKISNSYVPLIRIFNIILGTISLFLIFECAYLLFGKEKASLLSVLVYVITPWTYRYTGILFGLPTLVQFLSLLSLLVILLAFKYHKFSLHLLSVVSLLVLNQTKLEYFPYYLIYLIAFFVVREYRRLKKKEIIIFTGVVFLSFIPAILRNGLFKMKYLADPNWCGCYAQASYVKYSYGIIVTGIDHILQVLINTRITLSYFLEDLPVFFRFWSQSTLILPVTLAITGFFLSLKEYRYRKFFLWLPVVFFLSLAMGYLSDCGWYGARHAISAYGFLAIFSGYCLWYLLTKSGTRTIFTTTKRTFSMVFPKISNVAKYFIYFGIFCLILFQCFICSQELRSYREEVQSIPLESNSYRFYKDFMKGISNESTIFITADNYAKYILRILGYQSESFSDHMQGNDMVINYDETVNHFFLSDDLDFSNKIYFIKSPACVWSDQFAAFCDAAEKRSKKMVKKTYYSRVQPDYSLQLFLLSE